MSHNHERQVCRCGAVVMQCRCMAPKTDRVVCETCPKCNVPPVGGTPYPKRNEQPKSEDSK